MNPYKMTVLLALVLAGLGSYVYFVEVPTSREQVKTEKAEKRLVFFDDRDVTSLTITSATGGIKMMSDGQRRWRIVQPVEERADSRQVGKILRALVIGKVSRVVHENEAAPAKYGLDKPSATLTVTTGEQSETLSFGEKNPISSTLYAHRQSDDTILLTTLKARDVLDKSLDMFRKKNILHFDRTKVDHLYLRDAQKDIVLKRTPNAHGRPGIWKILSPIEAFADNTSVGILLMNLEDLTAVGFVDPGPERERLTHALGKPKAEITVQASGTNHTVSLFQLTPHSEEAYAATSPEKPLYRISPLVLRGLPRTLLDLQDKRLFGIEAEELALLTVKNATEEYVLINQTNVWTLEGHLAEPLDTRTVNLFVSRVADLPSELPIQKEKGSLAQYGLASPTVEFIGIDKRGKERGRLALGTREKGLVYARGAGLPGIHQARSDILTQIPTKHELLGRSNR